MKKILLVEDEAGEIRLFQEIYNELAIPHQLDVVRNGYDALKYIKENGLPDIIIADLNLPKMDGFDLMAHVRKDYGTVIPIIAFTTSNVKSDIERAYSIGVNAYITKPSDIDRLTEVIKMMFDYWFDAVQLPQN